MAKGLNPDSHSAMYFSKLASTLYWIAKRSIRALISAGVNILGVAVGVGVGFFVGTGVGFSVGVGVGVGGCVGSGVVSTI